MNRARSKLGLSRAKLSASVYAVCLTTLRATVSLSWTPGWSTVCVVGAYTQLAR